MPTTIDNVIKPADKIPNDGWRTSEDGKADLYDFSNFGGEGPDILFGEDDLAALARVRRRTSKKTKK